MRSLHILSRRVSAATTSQRACLRHSRCSLSTYGDLTAAALSEASSEGPSLDVLDALTEASPPQPVSISQMMLASGRTSPAVRLANAQFLRRELASRRAHVLSLLRTMPPPLASQPAVARLCVLNWQRLKGLLTLPELSTADDEKAFAAAMLDHSAAIDGESRRWPHLSPEEEALCVDALGTLQREPHLAVDKQLDAIFLARIGLRVLHEHYIRAVQPPRQGYAGARLLAERCSRGKCTPTPPRDCVGAIQLECSPVAVCEEAAAATRQQLQQRYGAAPPVEVVGERGHSFAFVPGHVRAVVGAPCGERRAALARSGAASDDSWTQTGALLFNSSVATLRHAALAAGGGQHQQYSFSGDERLPAVRVIVAGGDDLVQAQRCSTGRGPTLTPALTLPLALPSARSSFSTRRGHRPRCQPADCCTSTAPRPHLRRTSAAPRLHLGRTSAAPRPHLGRTSVAPLCCSPSRRAASAAPLSPTCGRTARSTRRGGGPPTASPSPSPASSASTLAARSRWRPPESGGAPTAEQAVTPRMPVSRCPSRGWAPTATSLSTGARRTTSR